MSIEHDVFSIYGWSEQDFNFDKLVTNIRIKDPAITIKDKNESMEVVCHAIESSYFMTGNCYSGEIEYFIGVPIKNEMTLDDVMSLRAGKLRTTMNLVQDYDCKLYEPKFYCEILVS